MIQKPENSQIAEKTISKVAEVVFASQIDESDTLDIRVKADPDRIISGTVDEIYVDSSKLSVSPNISMTSLDIKLEDVSVNPLKAVLGNAELSQPSEGVAQIVLDEGDIARVLGSQKIRAELRDRPEIAGVATENLELAQLSCQLDEGGQLSVRGRGVRSDGGADPVAIGFDTSLAFEAGNLELTETHLLDETPLAKELSEFALERMTAFLNLEYFTLDGVEVMVDRLKFEPGRLQFSADVRVEQIPE